MDEDRIAPGQLVAELADGLEERQALDVADGAADLHQHEVDALVAGDDEILDGVRDVRDHLHGAAEIVAAPLLGQDVLVDAARGDVVRLLRRHAGKALVVAEVEVRLRPVVRHEHLTVLVRAHGAGVDVEIGVQLAQPDRVAAGLEKRSQGRRCQPLSGRGDHAAGDEDVPRHGPAEYIQPARFEETFFQAIHGHSRARMRWRCRCSTCHPGRSASARRAGAQNRKPGSTLGLWVPDISLREIPG